LKSKRILQILLKKLQQNWYFFRTRMLLQSKNKEILH
jgi:hypothetical protein